MVLDQFSILLDNDRVAVLAGENVQGRLCITVTSNPKTFQGIFLQCKGYAYVGLTRTRSEYYKTPGYCTYRPGFQPVCQPDYVQHVSQDFLVTSREDFFYYSLSVLAAPSGQVTLDVGQHYYPFAFNLPHLIPSSYEGKYGHIRYMLKATMERPAAWNSYPICSMGFSVLNPVDLNLNPTARMPATKMGSKTICCWCCASGSITARAWISQSGFVPGETLYFNAEVENESGRMMRGSKFKLIETTTFHAGGKRNGSVRAIQKIKRGAFGPVDKWDNVPILIPSLTPSGPPYCSIIKISHHIEFSVDPGFFTSDLKLEPIKIIIGNIPLEPTDDDVALIPNVSELMKAEDVAPIPKDGSELEAEEGNNGDPAY